jgi:hypothetical protein
LAPRTCQRSNRRHQWQIQHRVHAGGRNLRRHLLAVAYVLGEIGAVAVKKHDHDRGAFGVKAWRNVQQHAVVTENLRLPKNIARKLMWPQWPSAPYSRTVGPNRAWCRDTGRAPSRNQRDLSVRRHWMGCARGWSTGGAAPSSDASRTGGFRLGFSSVAACLSRA